MKSTMICVVLLLSLLCLSACAAPAVPSVAPAAPSAVPPVLSPDAAPPSAVSPSAAPAPAISVQGAGQAEIVEEAQLKETFFAAKDGFPGDIRTLYAGPERTIRAGDNTVCVEKDGAYQLLDCFAFGKGDYRLTPSPDGRYVAAWAYDGQIIVMEADTGALTRLSAEGQSMEALAWEDGVLYIEARAPGKLPAYFGYDAAARAAFRLASRQDIPAE